LGRRPHWFLELIARRAGYQGKGAGGMLIRWGTDRADEEGLESYLDATPEGKPVYERYGFRELETLRFFGGKYAQCFMIRDAKTRK
jgi:GNAT superfamily N-acetyltransferase